MVAVFVHLVVKYLVCPSSAVMTAAHVHSTRVFLHSFNILAQSFYLNMQWICGFLKNFSHICTM